MNNNFSVVILAAGQGKRMQDPNTPKVLATLRRHPLLYYVLNTALQLQPENVCIIVGHQQAMVTDYVMNTFIPNYLLKNQLDIAAVPKVKFAVQSQQLGTGHAVQCSEQALQNYTGKVLILSGDVPMLTTTTLNLFIKNSADSQLAVLTAVTDNPTGYGRIIRDSSGQLMGIVEEKDATDSQRQINEVNSGIYFADATLLYPLLKEVKNTNNQQEFYLTDIIAIGLNLHKNVTAHTTTAFNETIGVNTAQQLAELEKLPYL